MKAQASPIGAEEIRAKTAELQAAMEAARTAEAQVTKRQSELQNLLALVNQNPISKAIEEAEDLLEAWRPSY